MLATKEIAQRFVLDEKLSYEVRGIRHMMERNQDERGWKYPLRPFVTSDYNLAIEYASCVDFYMGGHELKFDGVANVFTVTSKGYYHYVGA